MSRVVDDAERLGAAGAAAAGAPRQRYGPSNAPRWIAAATAAFALLMLAAATTGPWPGLVAGLQRALVPDAVALGVLRGVSISVSLGLLLLTRGLWRRQRRAWTAAVALAAAAAVLLLLRDLDVPAAFVAAALLVALVHWRREFYAVASTRRSVWAAAVAAAVLGLVFVFGSVEVMRHDAARGAPVSPAAATSQAAWGMIGQDSAAVVDEFSRNLVATLTATTVLTLAVMAWAFLRPPRGARSSGEDEWREVRRLVREAATDSLAYFALRRDKQYFFDEAHAAFLGYRAVAGIALVSGDPVGDPTAFARLAADFAAHCRRQAWRLAVMGVAEDRRALWEGVGLQTIYVGDEAVVLTSAFSLEGRSVRKLRQSVNRLERLGYTAEMRRAGELDAATLDDVVRVSVVWRGGQPERGFTMALDDVRSVELDDTLFVLARDAGGRLVGFLHFVPVPATGDLSLSAMRRLPDTPNGLNEFLISSLLVWGREHGVARVSLNFAVFGGLLRYEGGGPVARVAQGVVRFGDRFVQLERLLAFNGKFQPEWQPRYLAVQNRADLPGVALVLLHLENLLPQVRGGSQGGGVSDGGDGSDGVVADDRGAGAV